MSTPERLQIVDEYQNFTPELSDRIVRWGLRDVDCSYGIVAVLGSQSTGKSTLLNQLFGTEFDVMDPKKRQRTTKGIWLCRGQDTNIIVMDVEGTDSRDRGENRDFERKSALFSLASSEVLLINLWEHQVGLYQGANMGLLRTVFEVNLGLFGRKTQDGTSGRALLLFVIRDHFGYTPFDNLQATLTTDIEQIWKSLSKPEDLRDAKLSDYFDLAFTSLPHKLAFKDDFESEVRRLRNRFVDKQDPDYVFRPAYHKRVPADGVAFYMEKNWERVKSNEDLDIPTQQELVAQFRCDAISVAALAELYKELQSQKQLLEGGEAVGGLGKLMKGWTDTALERYKDASRYHQGVYERKRAELVATVDRTLSPLFRRQMGNLHKSCLGVFKKDILDGLKGEDYEFAKVLKAATDKCLTAFTEGATEAVVDSEWAQWSWEGELELLKEEVKSVEDQYRKDETKKVINVIERDFKTRISEPVETNLRHAAPNLWDTVLTTFKETLDEYENSYLSKAQSFNCTEEENTSALAILRYRAWQALRAKIDEQTADSVILGTLRNHFQRRFLYDENGTSRVWRSDDAIDGAFKKAQDDTLGLISLYSKIEPVNLSHKYTLPDDAIAASADFTGTSKKYDFSASLTVLSDDEKHAIKQKFRDAANTDRQQAKSKIVSNLDVVFAAKFAIKSFMRWEFQAGLKVLWGSSVALGVFFAYKMALPFTWFWKIGAKLVRYCLGSGFARRLLHGIGSQLVRYYPESGFARRLLHGIGPQLVDSKEGGIPLQPLD